VDANGTRFHLLLGRTDWGACHDKQRLLGERWSASPPYDVTALHWDAERSEVTLRPEILQFAGASSERPLEPEDRRGAGVDRYGNWYWIGTSGTEIRVNSSGTGVTTVFFPAEKAAPPLQAGEFGAATPPPPSPPCHFGGLAVTEDHYLVVGTLAPKGLLIFDLFAGGLPRRLLWPEAVPFTPFDMAAAKGGGVFILDRENRRYWVLDRHFGVVRADSDLLLEGDAPDDFQPTHGDRPHRSPVRSFPSGIVLDASSPLSGIDPVAIEALPDGTVLILDRVEPFSLVHRYRLGRPLGQPVSLEAMAPFITGGGASFRLVGHDFAFVPAHKDEDGRAVRDVLYVASAGGNQSFAFLISQREQPDGALTLDPLLHYLPMRLFGGKALVNGDGRPYYDFGDGFIPLIEQLRRRYVHAASIYTNRPAPSAPSGAVIRAPFDGREPDCVWHRLFLEGCIPRECAVEVWSRAANEKEELSTTPWFREPRLHLRADGSELPFVRVPTGEDEGVFELLFQRARGRYLELRLELFGNGGKTPRLRALRVYYPRFSYLERYLPAAYRDDEASASFLDRFLANLEGIFTPIEDRVAAAQILFDVRSAPPEALEWLASWFGAALDPAWDESRRRLFIRHAMDFYGYRGTIRGLIMALELAISDCPSDSLFDFDARPAARSAAASYRKRPASIRIVEAFRTRRTPGVIFGDPTGATGIREVSVGARWTPEAPRELLLSAWADAVGALGEAAPVGAFPLRAPPGAAEPIWRELCKKMLGFVPAATDDDRPAWAAFLARRYRTINALRAAYGSTDVDFSSVAIPQQLPNAYAALVDWYQFEGVVLSIRRAAHRFTVLLPVPPGAQGEAALYKMRQDLAHRIVELQKPANTVFDVKFYWAMFRLGEARLGTDTLIDRGSRSPELMRPMVLGEGPLAETYLPLTPAQASADRRILGKGRLGA
jgi:phage tail-like protein